MNKCEFFLLIFRPEWAEKQLLKKLLGSMDRLGTHARPVRNSSTPVPVMFGLGLIQMELNEKENTLSLSMWTRYVSDNKYIHKNQCLAFCPNRLFWL